MKKILLAFVLILLTALAFFYLNTRPEVGRSYSGGDFILQSKTGPVSLASFRGRVVLLYFGYTSCPDVCPTALSLMGGALRRLSAEEREKVAGIFVSVDPERDNVNLLSEYSKQFDPLIVGVTGSPEEVKGVADRYGVHYEKVPVESAMGYVVDHTSATYLIDREGQLVQAIRHGAPSAELVEAVRALLKKP